LLEVFLGFGNVGQLLRDDWRKGVDLLVYLRTGGRGGRHGVRETRRIEG
jgi:hypothetical protein